MDIDLDALFPKLVDLLLDPVFVVDETGRIPFVSSACEALLGYLPQELVGTWVIDHVLDLLQFVSTQVATAIERKQAQERLLHMAHHDVLTGLPNRALFYDRLDMALSRARRDDEYLALRHADADMYAIKRSARNR